MGRSSGEPAQDRLGGGGAVTDGGGVLDQLVVLLLDEVPADRAVPGQHRQQIRDPRADVTVGDVELGDVDPFQSWFQLESQQSGQAEPDFGLAVGVDVVGLYVHVGAVVHRPFDHGGDFRCGAGDQLRVDGHRLLVHVPVDQDAAAAVADVVLGEQVLVERPEVGGVGGDRAGAGTPDRLQPGGERRVGDGRGERPRPLTG